MNKKVKQISFLSAIVISVGSTIGAGIFFKNASIFRNAGGELGFMIASWLVAGLGILALGIALIEMTSSSKKDGGIMEWVKTFTHKKFSNYTAMYMIFVYFPLNFFAMPIYAVMSLQDALSMYVSFSGWAVAGMAFAIFLWFGIFGYISLKFSEKSQWVFTALKFIPLLVIPVMSIIQAADSGVVTNVVDEHGVNVVATGLTGLSPWLGIMASIPAILFAMDGFYGVTSLKSDLKDERKLGKIVFISVTSIIGIYLLFAILLGLTGSGSFYGINIINNNEWLIVSINIIIMFAVFGVINGLAMSAPRMYNDVYADCNLFAVNKLKKLFKTNSDSHSSYMLFMIITTIYFIILIPIGIYGWNATSYGYEFPSANNLYELTDLVSNFTSLMIFIFISGAIIGCLRNRKTNRVAVEKNKLFVPTAIISSAFMIIGSTYMLIAQMVDMSGINGADQKTEIVKFIILVISIFVPLIAITLANKLNRVHK